MVFLAKKNNIYMLYHIEYMESVTKEEQHREVCLNAAFVMSKILVIIIVF